MESRGRASTSTGASGLKHLEVVLLSLFQPSDPEGSGYIQPYFFWEVQFYAALYKNTLQL